MAHRPMLCPHCRRLIGSHETTCSWCGTHRSATRRSGGAWRGGVSSDWWLRSIIIVNAGFYLLSLLLGANRGISGNPLRMLAPQDTSLLLLGATGTIPIDEFGRIWSLVSANYLHGGLLHIFFNLMALRQIEPWVSQEFGPSRMFLIYSGGGVFGYLVSYLAGVPFTIGASAAICALIGALLYFGRSRGGAYGGVVVREVSGWVISLFLFGLLVPGINNWAHGGGIVGGAILGILLGYGDRRPETPLHHVLALICAATTIAVLGWACFGAFEGIHSAAETQTIHYKGSL